jgi:hypothetical protein
LEIENVTGNEAHLARRDPVTAAPPRR